MRLYKKIFFLAVFAMVFICAAPQEATKAAQEGLGFYLNSIPESMLEEYGFSNKEQLSQCSLGMSFQVKAIVPEKLRAYTNEDTVASISQETDIWYFTIVCAEKNMALLSVAKVDGVWKAVSLGNVLLATQLQNVQNTWTQERGFEPQIIVSYQARQYFFHIPQLNNDNLTTIELHAQQVMNYHYVGALSQVAENLWQEVQKNIAQREYEVLETEDVATFNATRQVLNLPQRYQKYNQWCWAGCSEAIFNYYGQSVAQERIAQEGTRGLNIWNWLWGVTNNPYRKGIRELLSTWGLRSSGLNSRLSYNALQAEIAAGRPVVVRWGWDNGGGHFVVCKGLSGSTSYVMDPWSGPTVKSYNWLCRGNGHTWTSTLKVSR